MPKNPHQVVVRLPADLYQAASERALSDDRPLSWVMRTALRHYLTAPEILRFANGGVATETKL